MSRSFRDRHPEVQHLVRELELVRAHNLQIKDGDAQSQLLLFAEAALVCLALERFARAVLGADATDRDTLPNLLQKAVSRKLFLVPWEDQEDGIRRIKNVRNTILHANYEQAARDAGCANAGEYFRTTFAAEVDLMHQIADHILKQVDPETGRPVS
jgi:hypothetical protein